jgi:hypothetical protein
MRHHEKLELIEIRKIQWKLAYGESDPTDPQL